MLSGLALLAPSGGLAAFPSLGAARGISVEFPALVVGLGVDSVAMLARFLAFEVRTLAIAFIVVAIRIATGIIVAVHFGHQLPHHLD